MRIFSVHKNIFYAVNGTNLLQNEEHMTGFGFGRPSSKFIGYTQW